MTHGVNSLKKVPVIDSSVLIIEDEGLMTALLKRYLSGNFSEKLGQENLNIGCYESGWDVIDSDLSAVKVAIVDLLVPRLSGVDFIKHLKHHYPHISFIPISGMATEPMKRQVRELLDQDLKFLEKPLRREEFQEAFLKAWNRTQKRLKSPKDFNPQHPVETQVRAPKEDASEPLWTAGQLTTSPKVIPTVRRVLSRKKGDMPDS
jgi:DNA-binding NtrC family response regulator